MRKGFRWHNNALAGMVFLAGIQIAILFFVNGELANLMVNAHANLVPLGLIFSPTAAITFVAKRFSEMDERAAIKDLRDEEQEQP